MHLVDAFINSLSGQPLMLVLACAEALAGLLALRNTRKECRARAVRSPQTVVAVWACFLLHSAVIALAAWSAIWPLPLSQPTALLAGLLVTAAGVTFAALGFWEFRSLQRMSGLDTGRLVTSGIYRISRNPQNVGWGLLLLGIALAGRSGFGSVLALGYWVVFRYYVVTEERHLAWIFSSKWERYAAHTPRFLSLGSLLRLVQSGDATASPATFLSHARDK